MGDIRDPEMHGVKMLTGLDWHMMGSIGGHFLMLNHPVKVIIIRICSNNYWLLKKHSA